MSITDPPIKPSPTTDQELLSSLHPELLDDSYVYVHCHFENDYQDMLIRIWKTTVLIDRASLTQSALLHAENISYAPQWTLIPDHRPFSFLLIFSGLPKSCTQFDLVEVIPEPGGFFIKDIARNEKDVYHVDLL